MFGEPSVSVDGTVVPLHNRRAFAIIARTALDAQPHARRRLAAECWVDAPQETANGNLRSVLSNLRRTVPGLLRITRDTVELEQPTSAYVDAVAFLHEVDRALGDPGATPSSRIAACESAISHVRGELLSGIDDLVGDDFGRWIETERRFLRTRLIDVLSTLVTLLREEKRSSEAITAGIRLVDEDPYREQSHVALIEALLVAGERHEAVRQLDRCRALIVDDLGVPLSASTLALADRVVADVDRPSTVATLVPLPTRPVLFGRDRLVADLVGRDRSGGSPIVTLTGAGGVGKTSLAVEVAYRWRAAGHDVVFVDLTEVESDAELPEAIARSLGSSAPADAALLESLVGGRDLRLVLDNFEHLSSGAVHLVTALVASSPRLTVVVTSRRPLRVADETLTVVRPLPMPADAASEQGSETTAAVQLFRHAARRRGATEELEDLAGITRLCRLLGGLPLALELAGAQVRSVGLDAMIERIGLDDIGVLDSDLLDVPDRHRSIARAVSDSLALLDPLAVDVFASTAVFVGPFTIDAIDSTLDQGHTRVDLHRALQSLVDLHLLQRDDRAGVWFSSLPAVRGVASHRLASLDRTDEVMRRRVDHDCALVLAASAEFQSANSRRWYAYLDAYQATVRETLDRLHVDADPREAGVVSALGEYWLDRGQFGEGARRLARCPEAASELDTAWTRPSHRMWEAILRAEAVGYGSATDVVDTVVECVDEICRVAPTDVALATMQLACHAFDLADRADLARPMLDAGLELAERSGAAWIAVELRYAKAMIAHVDGDDDAAAEALRRVLADAELHNNPRIEMYAHMLSTLIGVDGPAGGTQWSLQDLLGRAVELGDRRQVIWMLVSLGAVAFMEGDNAASARWGQEALTLAQIGGNHLGQRYCLMSGTSLAVADGDFESALEFHGAIEADLDFIARTMPRAYLEPYMVMVAMLDAEQQRDPSLGDARLRGATAPQQRTLARLADHFARFA